MNLKTWHDVENIWMKEEMQKEEIKKLLIVCTQNKQENAVVINREVKLKDMFRTHGIYKIFLFKNEGKLIYNVSKFAFRFMVDFQFLYTSLR